MSPKDRIEKLHLIYCGFSLLIRTFARKFYLYGCVKTAVADGREDIMSSNDGKMLSLEKEGHIQEMATSNRLASCASRAVGLPQNERRWFIAFVGNNQEKAAARRLEGMDYEVYLPVQEVVSVWKDGRRKLRERIVLPNLLFLHLTELERKDVVALPFVKRFMVDRAGKVDAYNRHPLAVIPDGQMERFKFMLGQDEKEVSMEPLTLKTGDAVRIIRGSLAGLEGHVYQGNSGKSYVAVKLDFLGCAIAEVALTDVELIQHS